MNLRVQQWLVRMPEFFRTGPQRILYKSRGFRSGLTVTAVLWNPELNKTSPLSLEELSIGLYYLDYDFPDEGTYIGLFYENGLAQIAQAFRVDKSIPEIQTNVKKLLQIERGRWKIEDDLLIIYDEDQVTPLFTFTLRGEQKKPYSERIPI